MEKEIAKINIFNSIFESIKDNGFSGLSDTLQFIPVDNNELNKFFDIKNSDSDYVYFNSFKSTPIDYSLKLAGIQENFNAERQKEWFKQYISNPNNYVRKVLFKYLMKLSMNSKLRNKLDEEFIECITESMNMNSKDFDSIETKEFNAGFTNEEFQDLIFITCAETIYNPEIEEKISERFVISNDLFWKRFNELYKEVFLKQFGESPIINDSFLLSEKIEEEKKLYGFEIIQNSMMNQKFPVYEGKFQYYNQFPNNVSRNRENYFEEYQEFRRKEFTLYNDLCEKYNINPIRTKMM